MACQQMALSDSKTIRMSIERVIFTLLVVSHSLITHAASQTPPVSPAVPTFQFNSIVDSQTSSGDSGATVARSAGQPIIESLWNQAQKLSREGKITEAIQVTQKLLELEREFYGEPHANLVPPLRFLAEQQEKVNDGVGAVKTPWRIVES